jgi:hypothetical protein
MSRSRFVEFEQTPSKSYFREGGIYNANCITVREDGEWRNNIMKCEWFGCSKGDRRESNISTPTNEDGGRERVLIAPLKSAMGESEMFGWR